MSQNINLEEKLKKCFDYIQSGSSAKQNIPIKLLKGGSYKIKQYYLENNNLNDIRGASVNLSFVEDKLIADKISKDFDECCIIYNGGGNIFCILPEAAQKNYGETLENEAQKYLITANTAFTVMDTTLDEVKKNYKETMRKLENQLSERKKNKIFNSMKPLSPFANKGKLPFGEEEISIDAKEIDNGGTCELCKTKGASYFFDGKKVCGSCLHKHAIGKDAKRSKYINEYEQRTGMTPKPCTSISAIDSDYVAVVYGDGNNMGQIIQNFTDITQMMEFSNKVKETSNRAVFNSMKSLSIDKFEIVGLGGDDVFIIISGFYALDFSLKLIDNYNKEFYDSNKKVYSSTMSVGICIAKSNTPIRVMLETAEDKLSEAKEISKLMSLKNNDTGSLAFAILDNPGEDSTDKPNKFGAFSTLQPYTYETAKELFQYINTQKKSDSASGKTRLRNLYDAYVNSDSEEEAYLYYSYQNAKATKKVTLPVLSKHKLLPNGLYECELNSKKAYIWKDILEIYDFILRGDNI